MAHDRIDGDTLPLTHEFLAVMLAVRRPGVTETLHILANQKVIRAERGQIVVLDRKGLERIAGEYYYHTGHRWVSGRGSNLWGENSDSSQYSFRTT